MRTRKEEVVERSMTTVYSLHAVTSDIEFRNWEVKKNITYSPNFTPVLLLIYLLT